MHLDVTALKRGLLAFWAIWLSVVFASNTFDALKTLGALPVGWSFASGNWAFLVQTTAIHGTPGWLNAVLYLGVIVWEGIGAALFWRAFGDAARGIAVDPRAAHPAFSVSLALWAAFMVVDELFIAYVVEAAHMRIFIAQLASLLVLHLVPEPVGPE
jgi:hypothetical protein